MTLGSSSSIHQVIDHGVFYIFSDKSILSRVKGVVYYGVVPSIVAQLENEKATLAAAIAEAFVPDIDAGLVKEDDLVTGQF